MTAHRIRGAVNAAPLDGLVDGGGTVGGVRRLQHLPGANAGLSPEIRE